MAAYSRIDNLLSSQVDSGLTMLRVAAVRNFTIEPLIPVIRSEFARLGFYTEMYLGDFDNISLDMLSTQSKLYDFDPELLLMFLWLESLSPKLTLEFIRLSEDEIKNEIKRIINEFISLVSSFRRNSNATILVSNFTLNDSPTLGILDSQLEWGQKNAINFLNKELLKAVSQQSNIYIVDYQLIFSRYGFKNAVDERYWSIARAPIKSDVMMGLGVEYSKFLQALKGKTKKCLVLDCDNTLWGGIVGEDGINGISIGEGFKSFQAELLNLYHRGVILTICSKNNELDVLDVFDRHPEMVLKRAHFAAWQINWEDKASNIAKIAKKLNIGIESLVFVDDSIFECEWVGQKLPSVSILNLRGDASTFKRQLNEKSFFDALTYTAEDRSRTEMYRGALQSEELLNLSEDYSDYLMKLELKAEIGTPDALTVGRVSQLTQKTNQFNLTSKRYTEGQISEFIKLKDVDVFYLKLKDKFIDLGLVGVAITKLIDGDLHIDTLLLSCRALGRGAEDLLVDFIVEKARTMGCKNVIGRYMRTEKNDQVKDLFGRLGFIKKDDDNSGSSWVWNIQQRIDRQSCSWIELVTKE